MNKTLIFFGAGIVVGASAGFAAGALVSSKKHSAELDALSQQNERLSKRVDALSGKDIPEKKEEEKSEPEPSEEKPKDLIVKNDIHRLSEEEFDKATPFRDYQTYVYYKKDGVLCSERGYAVEDARTEKLLSGFDEQDFEDVDTIYIEDSAEDELYEIVIEREESYY